MKGEKDFDQLLEYAPVYDTLPKQKEKKNEKTKGVKKNPSRIINPKVRMIKSNKALNPIETFYNILQSYETENFEKNVYFQCVSFILQAQEEQIIPPGQQKEFNTNFLFGDFKLRRKNPKRELIFEKLHNMLKYYISNDIVTEKHVRTLFKSGCVSDLMGELLKVSVINNSVQEYLIPQGTIVAKIFIYAEMNK